MPQPRSSLVSLIDTPWYHGVSRCEWRVCAAGQTICQTTDDHADPCGVADGTVHFYSRFGAGDTPYCTSRAKASG